MRAFSAVLVALTFLDCCDFSKLRVSVISEACQPYMHLRILVTILEEWRPELFPMCFIYMSKDKSLVSSAWRTSMSSVTSIQYKVSWPTPRTGYILILKWVVISEIFSSFHSCARRMEKSSSNDYICSPLSPLSQIFKVSVASDRLQVVKNVTWIVCCWLSLACQFAMVKILGIFKYVTNPTVIFQKQPQIFWYSPSLS